MDAVLVAPPYVQDDAFRPTLLNPVGENLGLELIFSSCKERGYDTRLLSCPVEQLSAQQAAKELVAQNPSVIGLSLNYEQTDLRGGLELAEALRLAGYKGMLVAGGMAATFLAADLIQTGHFDVVVKGEGEVTFPQVVEAASAGKRLSRIPGLLISSEAGPIDTGPSACPEFDRIPTPDRVLLGKLDPRQATSGVPLETSRGCPGHCSFCVVPRFHGFTWRPRQLSQVVDEMKSLKDSLGANHFEFVDDNFFGPTSSPDRAHELASLMGRRHVDVRFALSCRADCVTKESIQPLVDCGLERLHVGIESGSPSMLRRLAKGISVEENRRAVDLLASFDIPVDCCFIMFDPYTTLQELRETLFFLGETGAHTLGMRPHNLLNSLLVIRGTPVYENLKDSGLLIPNGRTFCTFRFADPQVEFVHKVVASMDAIISPMELRFRKVYHPYSRLLSWLRRKYGMDNDTIARIPELHHDFMTRQYWSWYNSLPGLVYSTLQNVVDLVARGIALNDDNVESAKMAVCTMLAERLRTYFGPGDPFDVLTNLDHSLSQNVIRLTTGHGVMVFDNPIFRR